MDQLKTLINNIKNVSDSTKKTYFDCSSKILKDYKSESIDIFNDYDNIIQYLESKKYTEQTFRTKIKTILVIVKHIDNNDSEIINKYSKKLVELTKNIDNNYKTHELSDEQKQNYMSVEELNVYKDKLFNNLPKKVTDYDELLKFMNYFLLDFHINYPIRNDLADCVIVKTTKQSDKSDDFNYFVTDDNDIILNKYKTKKEFGQLKFKIIDDKPIKLYIKMLKKYKKEFNIENNYLLINKDGNNVSRLNYTKILLKIFEPLDKKISSTMLRRIVASDNLYDIDKIEKLQNIMGHSINIQFKIYCKKV